MKIPEEWPTEGMTEAAVAEAFKWGVWLANRNNVAAILKVALEAAPTPLAQESDEFMEAVKRVEVSLESLFHVMNNTEIEPEIVLKNIARAINQLRSARQK